MKNLKLIKDLKTPKDTNIYKNINNVVNSINAGSKLASEVNTGTNFHTNDDPLLPNSIPKLDQLIKESVLPSTNEIEIKHINIFKHKPSKSIGGNSLISTSEAVKAESNIKL